MERLVDWLGLKTFHGSADSRSRIPRQEIWACCSNGKFRAFRTAQLLRTGTLVSRRITMLVLAVKYLVMTGLTALALAFGIVIVTDLSR